jgi:hypothetical protein
LSPISSHELEVFEDGVKQDVAWLTLSHGGRIRDLLTPPAPAREGVIVPPNAPAAGASGRIFVIVLDDLHLDFGSTGRVRDLVARMLRVLIHDGDMFAIVSTGTSSISQPLTYDRQVLEAAIAKMTGEALTPEEHARQPARDRGRHEWVSPGQSQRLRRRAEAHRRGDQRLLCARLLLDEREYDASSAPH